MIKFQLSHFDDVKEKIIMMFGDDVDVDKVKDMFSYNASLTNKDRCLNWRYEKHWSS
jgi:hypothetical protein